MPSVQRKPKIKTVVRAGSKIYIPRHLGNWNVAPDNNT